MSFQSTLPRSLTILLLIPLLIIGGINTAAALSSDNFVPDTLFLQAGTTDSNTQTYAAGATWDWSWRRQYSFGTVTGYSEVSFGRWITDAGDGGSAWETQVGITPDPRGPRHPTRPCRCCCATPPPLGPWVRHA